MPIYLQLGPFNFFGDIDDDDAIKGFGTESNHLRWIPALSCDFKRDGNTVPISRERREGPAPLPDLVIRRRMDGTSMYLFRRALNQSPASELDAIIDFLQRDGSDAYLRIKLTDTSISAYSAGTGADPTESFVLSATK
jgi:hypothetical protein